MAQPRISRLIAVTEAVFQQEYQKVQPLLEREAHLSQQLAHLNAQVSQVRSDSAQTEGYCVTGSDMLWHGWESATRRQLNLELARLRSQKLVAIDGLRKAFGRKQAVEKLALEERDHARRRQQKILMKHCTE